MFDDDRDFWADESTRSFGRSWSRPVRSHPAMQRRHTSTFGGHGRRRGSDRQVDPFLLRLGLMTGVIVLIVPAALSLRADNGTNILRTTPGVGAVALPAPGSQPAVTPAPGVDSSSVAPTAALTETTLLDPPSSPPATLSSAVLSSAAPRVEAKAGTPSCDREYEVAAGDYWILIARKVSVTVKELLAANNATVDTAIYPGRTVCLPGGASTPTPATTVAKSTTTTKAPTTTTVPKAPTTTAAPPTTAAPTTTTVARRSYSRTEVEAIIREVWPDDLEEEALVIATRESNLLPTAKNSCCFGLFQIYYSVHKGWLAQIGVTSGEQLFEPRVNATAALTLYYRVGGWGPWNL